MKMKRLRKEIAAVFAGTMLCFSSMAFAAASLPIEVNQSYCLNAGDTIVRMAIGNPDIADVTMASATEALVVGKASGATTLIIWTNGGGRQEYQVRVGTKDSNLEYILSAEMNLPNVHVQRVDKNIMLSGTVNNQQERDLAKKLAGLYVGKDNVIDMIQMNNPTQIQLEAQILEITTDDKKKIGLQYASPTAVTTDSTSGFNTVTMADAGTFSIGENFNNRDTKYWIFNHLSPIDASINALIQNGKARIISRPSIATMSGEKASILIGGKIPVPISNSNGNLSIEWHEYGIKLNIEPVADKDNNVTSKVEAEVSTLDYAHEVKNNNFDIPAIATREAKAVINVPSGMTMAIGGLLNTEESKTITRVPLLSNIPILGELFKHNSTSIDKREIIVLITPHIVNETTPVKMTDKMKEAYDTNREDDLKRKSVDLNQPETDAAKADASVSQKKQSTAPAKDAETKSVETKVEEKSEQKQDDSILGKYLNRNVLPKEESTK